MPHRKRVDWRKLWLVRESVLSPGDRVDDWARVEVWNLLKNAPPPVGYDPAIVPIWSAGPTAESFAALGLRPWRLRVFPGTVLLGQGGEVLNWRAPDEEVNEAGLKNVGS